MAAAPSSSTCERHCENLTSLCQICGCVFTGYYYSIAKFNQELKNVFSVDFKDDIVGVQPPNFCVKCYAIITSSAKRDGNTSIIPILWIPHSNDCTTCELRAAKSKDGRPKKKARGMGGGRPSKKGTEKVTTEDILKLDPGKPIPQCVEKALSHVISIKMKQSKWPNKSVQLSTAGPHPFPMTPPSQ